MAYILFCKDIELACDEKVIRDMTFEEKKQYSKVLLACSQQRRLVMACPLAFGEVGVKERVKSVLNHKKPAFWIIVVAIAVCMIMAVCFLTNPTKEYRIRVTIPAGSTESFCYSDEEICPKGKTLTLYAGEGLGDAEIILLPVEVREENAYEATYITPGMPVKMDVEKGAWFKIGVNMQKSSEDNCDVYVCVKNVEVRMTSKDNETDGSKEAVASQKEVYVVKKYGQTPEEKVDECFDTGVECIYNNYYEMSDGTWKTDAYDYKYRLEISGRMNNAAKDTTYVLLSNKKDITFEQAWKASGLSSIMADYFNPKDAVIVGIIVSEPTSNEMLMEENLATECSFV